MADKEAVEFAFDKLEQYFDAARQVIEQYGGETVDLGLLVMRVDALSNLVPALVFLLTTIVVGVKWGKPFAGWLLEGFADVEIVQFMVGIFGGMAFLFAAAVSFLKLTNVWSWIGLFYPQAYAVYKLIN